jgi:hypothetical protein
VRWEPYQQRGYEDKPHNRQPDGPIALINKLNVNILAWPGSSADYAGAGHPLGYHYYLPACAWVRPADLGAAAGPEPTRLG